MGKLSTFAVGVMTGLTAAAIGQELAKEPQDRTWKGTVAGVPYNFRLNEWSNVAREYWNPQSDRVLSPHTIGVGWGINFAALIQWLRRLTAPTVHTVESDTAAAVPEPIER
ncbi:MAG: DUF5808 domain-containing protein [Ktedonobacterales bacterium]